MKKTFGVLLILLTFVGVATASVVSRNGTISATGGEVVLQITDKSNGIIQIDGTFVGTINFEGTVNGTTWFTLPATPVAGGASVTSTTTTGAWALTLPVNIVRVNAPAWTSGTANVSMLFTTSGGGGSGGGGGGAVTVTSGSISLVTPNADSAMDETLNAAKVVVENVLTAGGQSAAAGVTAYPNCTSQAFLKMTTATTTQLVALTSGELIRVCHIVLLANGTTTATFVSGTGSNCATSQDALTPAYDLTAQVGFVAGNGAGVVLDAGTTAEALCVTNSQAVNLSIFVRYAKY